MWWLMFIPAWLFQNVVHEGSHLLAAWFSGRKPLGLYPYPHFHQGRFYFARCTWKHGIPLEPRNAVMVAPLYGFMAVELVVAALLLLVPADACLWLLPFSICALVDALWWVRGLLWGSPHSDAQRWLHGG
jgi:hypothetical protein